MCLFLLSLFKISSQYFLLKKWKEYIKDRENILKKQNFTDKIYLIAIFLCCMEYVGV